MKVSVIIPYKEDRGWLDQAIKSVQNQSWKKFEIILSQGDCGVSENLNKGIEQATGDLIRYLCDDDLLPRDSLFHTVRNWKQEWDWMHSKAVNFNSELGTQHAVIPQFKNPSLENMLLQNRIHGGTVVYHARCFENGNRFDETLWTGEEYDFNLALMKAKRTLGYLDEFTYLWRRHPDQKSVGNKDWEYQAKRKTAIEQIKNKYRT